MGQSTNDVYPTALKLGKLSVRKSPHHMFISLKKLYFHASGNQQPAVALPKSHRKPTSNQIIPICSQLWVAYEMPSIRRDCDSFSNPFCNRIKTSSRIPVTILIHQLESVPSKTI